MVFDGVGVQMTLGLFSGIVNGSSLATNRAGKSGPGGLNLILISLQAIKLYLLSKTLYLLLRKKELKKDFKSILSEARAKGNSISPVRRIKPLNSVVR